jgi:CDP-glycerol glycerophosphotransferase (TagB/SpsB family)
MAKSTKKATNNVLTMSKSTSTKQTTTPTSTDIAARAFELYCKRGCQVGHDVEDWLQAERELQDAAKSATAA